MSQAGVLSVNTSGTAVVETLTGNSGGAVGPDGSFNINILGNNTGGINIVGTPGTNTLTVNAMQATTLQRGTVFLATNAQAIAGTDSVNAVTSAALATKLGTQTAHSLAVFEGSTSALTALGAASNGQLPIGSTGADPVLSTITAGTGISVTNGAGSITIAVSGSTVVETLTGNSGGAISPTAGNINTLGSGSITIAGAGSTLTTQLTGLNNHSVLVGAGTATITSIGPSANTGQILQNQAGADPSYSTATYPATTTINQLLYSSAANTVGGLATANNGLLVTSSAGVPSILAGPGTTGTILQSNAAAAPSFSTATYPSVATGTGTLLRADGTNWVATTSTYPNTNAVSTLLYASSTNVMSALATANNGLLVTSNTGVPSILAGPGTTGQILQANAAAAPSFSTASYPSTTTVSQILYSSATNTVAGLATANQGVLTTGATGTPVITALATNGQLIIGSTAGVPAAATLSAGSGISITNGSNSITIAVSGGGETWTDVTGATQALAVSNGYITDRGGGVTYTLPASGALGDLIQIVGKLGLTTIAQNANQQIVISSLSSTVGVGGSVVGTNVGDSIELRCITSGASTVWRAASFVGNWTVV